jgi:hypothetical protein
MDNEGTNRANTTSGPAGWTHLGQIANSTNNVNLDVWYKFRASGDPSSFKWSVGPDPQDIVGGIIALSGVSSTTPGPMGKRGGRERFYDERFSSRLHYGGKQRATRFLQR